MAKQSKAQKETVERVMHEFKHGELRTRGTGPKVKNPKQAIAIALNEAGASNQNSPKENQRNLARTKRRERKGETERASAERSTSKTRAARGADKTKAELYSEAKRREIPGRSKMNKAELERALKKG